MCLESKIPPKTRAVLKKIGQLAKLEEIPVYVVGGFVRDLILGINVNDLDFVVIGDALAFARHFKEKFGAKAFVVYPKFGTTMLNHDNFKIEFVSARKESYQSNSRKPKVWSASLNSDLSRRDFTINTLAIDVCEENFGTVVDIFEGRNDIINKIIRTPLDPVITFADDPLRMMRAIRFSTQLSFTIEEHSFAAIQQTASRIRIVSQERITDEFNKILKSPKPSVGLRLLDESGILQHFLPEFLKTKGVEQKQNHHHKDVFYHTLQVLDQVAELSDRLDLRLAALFHDIAKPRTKRYDPKNGWTFHGHEVVGERMTAAILHRLKYPGHVISYVRKLVRLHLRPMVLVSENVTDSAIRRLLFLAGEEFDDLMKLCRADITSKNPRKIKNHLKNYEIVLEKAIDLEERDKLKAFKSPVTGTEIMETFNLLPGPEIGIIKKFIEEAILEGKVPNEHDTAFQYMIKHKDELITH
jgi:poly(A) polymerase